MRKQLESASVEKADGGVFFGWYIVAASIALYTFYGGTLMFGFPVLVRYILEDYEWSRGSVGLAAGILAMEAGLLTPLYGWIVDRYGTRGPTLVGAVIGAVGFVVLSRTDSLAMFYTGFFLAGLGLGVWWVTPLAAITNWFAARRTLAIGIAMTGWGLSGTVAPVLVSLIERYGWRSTVLGIAAATLVVGVSLGSLLRYRPEDHGYSVDGVSPKAGNGSRNAADIREPPGLSALEALRTREFRILAVI